jgi:phosphoribosylpyrophosphate synthetase
VKVHFICGYYSELAHKAVRRTEEYWDAYFFVWAIKKGTYKRDFTIHTKKRPIRITPESFSTVRPTFGSFIASTIEKEATEGAVWLAPVPSKDGLVRAEDFRSLSMLRESVASTKWKDRVISPLRWTEKLSPAHEGGSRSRAELIDFLTCKEDVSGKAIILVDDLVSTGGSLLASRDKLLEAGANVIGAVTCGKTVYDFNTKAFGAQEFWLEAEIADYSKA